MEMSAATATGYTPPPEFEVDTKDSLVKANLSDTSELWLIQWPVNQGPDFDGQELTIELHNDGHLGSFKGSSGKEYMVSSADQEPDATVFLSGSESKIVGKISRRVALVHYPDPDELNEVNSTNFRRMYQKSGNSMTTSSRHFATQSQGFKSRNSLSGSGLKASTQGSRQKSSLSEVGEPSKPLKKRHADEPSMSTGQYTNHSAVTSSGSFQHSHQSKSHKKIEK